MKPLKPEKQQLLVMLPEQLHPIFGGSSKLR